MLVPAGRIKSWVKSNRDTILGPPCRQTSILTATASEQAGFDRELGEFSPIVQAQLGH
jgi:hypothetical protein